ncbi:unnamed protein product [Lactuca virosa]|uniref:40S ribosomal protein S27 n=1 Tax=Lactuca virosa TaxID=75947 RepID=A0AAU9LM37_9ASTR|nr:unnamed protein product [Lactuca virosa]
MVLPNNVDLLNPPAELEKRKHKLKRLVQSPNSFFMDVKFQGCFNITTIFSHSQTVVVCGNCQTVLCHPTGGHARLTEGCESDRLLTVKLLLVGFFCLSCQLLLRIDCNRKARYLQDARLAIFEVSSARLAVSEVSSARLVVSEVSSASSRLQKSL